MDHYDVKQVIVLRTDLRDTEGHKISRGKQAAMCAHASLKVFFDRMAFQTGRLVKNPGPKEEDYYGQIWESWWTPAMIQWKEGDFAKIILGCDSLNELFDLMDKANKINVPYAVIEDNGTTCFGGAKTITCAAFGPDYSNRLNQITGNLKLLV
jgi:PTH2 family peptidyl-tRNA hydrolase